MLHLVRVIKSLAQGFKSAGRLKGTDSARQQKHPREKFQKPHSHSRERRSVLVLFFTQTAL